MKHSEANVPGAIFSHGWAISLLLFYFYSRSWSLGLGVLGSFWIFGFWFLKIIFMALNYFFLFQGFLWIFLFNLSYYKL
jgi:hypothetical protein